MRSTARFQRSIAPVGLVALTLLACLAAPPAAQARIDVPAVPPGIKGPEGIYTLDGDFVHNVGQMHLNITNFGLIGSQPTIRATYSDAPSAMWPAGSGVDYLWSAGMWFGALKNGVPAVSVGQYAYEFRPDGQDPLDTIYEMRQGEPGGARYPDPNEDDDGDGLLNEDPKNALDDDGDGLIDEDFAAIGNQHFRCTYTDYSPQAIEAYPDHEPLFVDVVQESFQWENDSVDDFVGFQFRVTNSGVSPIDDIYLGFFADPDCGPRGGTEIANDDLPGFFRGNVRAKDGSVVPVSVAYQYDADGDNGQTTGYLGIMFLNHDTDPTGETAPEQVGITSFQAFSGQAPFDRGGDPTNDAERYELLSREEFDNPPQEENRANDFRILLASGPFAGLEPGESLTFQAAIVIGEGLQGMVRNATEAALTYYGAYFDRDVDRDTGVKGRESRICIDDFGPRNSQNPIFDLFIDCVDSLDLVGDNPPTPISEDDLDEDGCVYINGDCEFERVRVNWPEGTSQRDPSYPCLLDGTGVELSQLAGCTGVDGKEYNVPWLVGLAPSPPRMRLWQTNNRVHVFFDNRSQLEKDVRLQRVDFESYRIWRADGWERPFGSSVENGPESRLWRLIGEYDVVDSFTTERTLESGQTIREKLPLGANTGLEPILYTPKVLRPDSWEANTYRELASLVEQIVEENKLILNTQTLLRYRNAEGEVTEAGMLYPQLADWNCCYDQLDSLYWSKLDPPVQFYEYVDQEVHNGIYYFYAVTATDFEMDPTSTEIRPTGPGLVGDPQSNFEFATPKSDAQRREERRDFGENIYVVPNPATRDALAEFSKLFPNSDDPTGVRVEFRNLPRARNTVRIFTLSGDLIIELPHDGRIGDGSLSWNLVSRNGQEVVSGIYLYSVESEDDNFNRVVGKFVVVR